MSRENYLGATRTALSSLPFPYSFTFPTTLRQYAVRRCKDIGDVQDLDDDKDNDHQPPHQSLTHTWLTRRRAWHDKARELKVSPSTNGRH